VASGDWVVADADGVAVVAASRLVDVRDAARDRAEREASLFAKLADGADTVDLLGLDPSTVLGRAAQ
jgi:4-hydroxy-4-methyl-2-oxoglutarate aldolase